MHTLEAIRLFATRFDAAGIEIDLSLIRRLATDHRLAGIWEKALQSPDSGLE